MKMKRVVAGVADEENNMKKAGLAAARCGQAER